MVRVRLLLGLPDKQLAGELDRSRGLVHRLACVPEADRARLARALGRCSAAIRSRSQALGWRGAAPPARAVHCPRMLVPLARARAATLAPLPGSRLWGHVVGWLALTAGLLLLLAPLFDSLRRRS